MTLSWYLAATFLSLCPIASASTCLDDALQNAARFTSQQHDFQICFKSCAASFTQETPERSLFTDALIRPAGLALCSSRCVTESTPNPPISGQTLGHPFSAYIAVATKFRHCADKAKREGGANDVDLANFNLAHLTQEASFPAAKSLRLFSIFYPAHLQYFWQGAEGYDGTPTKCTDVVLPAMQRALKTYFTALEMCQTWCFSTMAGSGGKDYEDAFQWYTSVAGCQHGCFYLFRYDPAATTVLLPDIHHYLQYCLWHTGDRVESVRHAASYIAIAPPNSEAARALQNYFATRVLDSEFVPPESIVKLVKSWTDLTTIAKLRNDMKWIGMGASQASTKTLAALLEGNNEKVTDDSQKNDLPPPPIGTEDKMLEIVGNFSGVFGHRRYVVDGIVSEADCQALVELNGISGIVGDGYSKTMSTGSPYTLHESYTGLAPDRLTELIKHQQVSLRMAKLFLNSGEAVRSLTQRLFGLDHLYFFYSHLVCRKALEDFSKGELIDGIEKRFNDPSHPVHADNCAIQSNGDCLFSDSSLLPRDYSALLYLNEPPNFTGGEFFFADRPNKTETQRVQPLCGRVVAFSGAEFHGVRAVTNGKRCAMALWFTLDEKHQEKHRLTANQVVANAVEPDVVLPMDPVGPEARHAEL